MLRHKRVIPAVIVLAAICSAANISALAQNSNVEVWQPGGMDDMRKVNTNCSAEFHISAYTPDVKEPYYYEYAHSCSPERVAFEVHKMCLAALHDDQNFGALAAHFPADARDMTLAQLSDDAILAKGQEKLVVNYVAAEKSCDAHFVNQMPNLLTMSALFASERSQEMDAWVTLSQRKTRWGSFNKALKDISASGAIQEAAIYQKLDTDAREKVEQLANSKAAADQAKRNAQMDEFQQERRQQQLLQAEEETARAARAAAAAATPVYVPTGLPPPPTTVIVEPPERRGAQLCARGGIVVQC